MATRQPSAKPRHGLRRWFRPPWSWQGATAMVLAATVVTGVFILAVGIAFRVQRGPLPENLAGLLTAVMSALIGAVATFLGRVGSNLPTEETRREADKRRD